MYGFSITNDDDKVIEDSLGKPIDEMFVWLSPTPIASGSVGQVHHGTLRPEYALADGSCDVAVKVTRCSFGKSFTKIPISDTIQPRICVAIATTGEFSLVLRRICL